VNLRKPVLIGVLALAGCQSLDKTLDTADRAIGVANSPTAKSVTDIAGAGDRRKALREGLKRRAGSMTRPGAAGEDLRAIKARLRQPGRRAHEQRQSHLGQEETRLPSRTNYIKYTQNYKSRARSWISTPA
jgi:hypothetical protein